MNDFALIKHARNRAGNRRRYAAIRGYEAGRLEAPRGSEEAIRGAVVSSEPAISFGKPLRGSVQGPARRKRKGAIAAPAVEAVMDVVRSGDHVSPATAIARLRQLVRADADLRPRHAALALAIADALTVNSAGPQGVEQREALRRAALTLLDSYISLADERAILNSLSRSGLERFVAIDAGPIASLLAE